MNTSAQPDAANTVETGTVVSNVSNALASADATVGQRLQTLGLVQQARLARLSRAANSAAAEYGATSAQATAAQAAVKTSQATLARIATMQRLVTISVPTVAANGWALYGHVYNAQLQPVAAYTVFLVDEQKNYQSAYGFAYTAADGSFVINYPGTPKAPASVPLFIEIADANAQPVYIGTAAFQPKTGAATYQDITLPAGDTAIGDPPAQIRAVALPQKKKAKSSK
jgi:hypothetical protein